jgi:hypothetical protein
LDCRGEKEHSLDSKPLKTKARKPRHGNQGTERVWWYFGGGNIDFSLKTTQDGYGYDVFLIEGVENGF